MRALEPLGVVQIEESGDIGSDDELRLILGHAEGGEEAHLFPTELPPKASVGF